MSRFVIQGKLYDTDKMAHIGTVKKWFKDETLSAVFGGERGRMEDCKLFRSQKGNHLLVHEGFGFVTGCAIKEDEAKMLLMRYDYEHYRQIYGDLEEA